MGMFDNLLGGDEEDREEMQENIEKIRDKVQGEGPPPTPEGRRGPEDTPTGGIRPERRGSGPREPPRDERQEPERPERPPRRESRTGREESEPSPPPSPREAPSGERPEPEPEGPTREDVPEPPEVKELDVPDIEKGPLFITVDKFRDALNAIADLRRVASDMEDHIGSMEETLQEDRDTEDMVRGILDDAEADTEELKDIVSP